MSQSASNRTLTQPVKGKEKNKSERVLGFIFYFPFASVHLRVYLRTFGCIGRGDIAGGGTDTVISMCPFIRSRNSIHILAQSPALALDSTPSGRLHFVTKSGPTQLYSYASSDIPQPPGAPPDRCVCGCVVSVSLEGGGYMMSGWCVTCKTLQYNECSRADQVSKLLSSSSLV
jgi:hypothetical protein